MKNTNQGVVIHAPCVNAQGKIWNVLWLQSFHYNPKSCLCSWNKVQPPQSLINSPSVLPFHQWALFFSKCVGWRGNLKASESSFTVCWLCSSHGASSPHVGQIKVQAPFAPWQKLLHGNKCGRECERVILPFYRCWCATSELPHQKSLSSFECCLA